MPTPVSDLPPIRKKGTTSHPYAWVERLAPVRERPGQWFQLDGDWSQSVAGAIRAGRVNGVARGEFETRRRTIGGGRYLVFVRYVGAPSTSEPAPVVTPAWTAEAVAEWDAAHGTLPRRWTDKGELEVRVPADESGPERWVSPQVRIAAVACAEDSC